MGLHAYEIIIKLLVVDIRYFYYITGCRRSLKTPRHNINWMWTFVHFACWLWTSDI